MHQIAERIYTTVVDEATFILLKDGYKVVVSQAYPAQGEHKHIIWHNSEKKSSLYFTYDHNNYYYSLYYHLGDDIPEARSTKWVFLSQEELFAVYESEYTQEELAEVSQSLIGAITLHIADPGKKQREEQKETKNEEHRITAKRVRIAIGIITVTIGFAKMCSNDPRDYFTPKRSNYQYTLPKIKVTDGDTLSTLRTVIRSHVNEMKADTSTPQDTL